MPECVAQARLAASWLRLGAGIDAASLGFTLLAVAALLWTDAAGPARLGLFAAMLAGLGEKFLALRVAFDRDIFSAWSRRWESAPASAPADDLAAFDAALAATGLRRPAAGRRPLPDRVRGAFRLMTYQAILFIMQAVALIAAILCRHGF